MKHKKGENHSPTTIERFWQLKSEGWPYKVISKKLRGVSRHTLADWASFRTREKINRKFAKKYGELQ